VKLSAKLFTALAALALLVVAVVGTSQTTWAAATDGEIHLTNGWSKLTTNPDGFEDGGTIAADETYVGSGKTLYSTFQEATSAGTSTQSIESNSDRLWVTVVDADKDVPVRASSTTAVGGNGMDAVGETQIIPIPLFDSPIVDYDDDGDVDTNDVIVTNNGTSTIAVSSVVAGSATQQGIVSLVVTNSGGTPTTIQMDWKTSEFDTVQANVASTQDPTGIDIELDETAAGSGIFRAEVQLLDREFDTNISTSTLAGAAANTLVILTNNTVTATYTDDTPEDGGDDEDRTASAIAETTPPQVTVSGPAHESATQDETPVFEGTVTDSGSGLLLESSVEIFIDQTDDPDNGVGVVVTAGAADPDIPATAADGDASVSWDYTPGLAIPSAYDGGQVDHSVDWQVRANDLAGNVGFSDADDDNTDNLCITGGGCGADYEGDAPGEGAVPGRGEPHVIQIDQKIPGIDAAYTGHTWDATDEERDQNTATSIEVLFDGDMLASSLDNTDFEVVIDGATHVPSDVEVYSDIPSSVWLTMGAAVPSDEEPVVWVVDQISDSAGNTANSGSKTAVDSLAPEISFELTGGSSITDPTGLTKDDITVTITSDETLSEIRVKVYDAAGNLDATVIPVNLGSNRYQATLRGSALDEGDLAVVVEATDSADAAIMDFDLDGAVDDTIAPNQRIEGDDDVDADDAVTYELDETDPALTVTPAVETDLTNPFVTLDFNEDVTIDVATFDDVDISGDLVTTDDTVWIYQASGLTLDEHEVVAQATDLAGNQMAEDDATFDVVARDDFELTLVAGWNAISVPADPVVVDIDSVFTNTSIDQVIAYDATHAASPWRIATKDSATGLFVSTTELSLNSVRQGVGYWVHTDNFEAQDIALTPPIGPGSASPPAVVTIPTGNGWNFIGVISVTGANTTGASGLLVDTATPYFASVNWSRAYSYNATALQFVEVAGGGNLNTGQGIWVFVSPQADGSLPAIVP